MTEPKKRGRPSKAEIAAREAAKNARVEGGDVIAEVDPIPKYVRDLDRQAEREIDASQAYALRVWSGQSPSADRPWRIQRVKEALEGQGLSMEGVILPN